MREGAKIGIMHKVKKRGVNSIKLFQYELKLCKNKNGVFAGVS